MKLGRDDHGHGKTMGIAIPMIAVYAPWRQGIPVIPKSHVAAHQKAGMGDGFALP